MKFGITGILISISLILICAFPPIYVEQTTQASRIAWFSFLATLALVTGGAGFAHYRATGRVMDDYSGDYSRRYFKLLGSVSISLFTIVIAMSIALVNLNDSSGWLGSFARLLPAIVDPVFPWIDRFRNAKISSPNDIQAMKVEALMSLSFIFGLVVVAVWTIYYGFMPKAELKIAAHQANKYQKQSSKTLMLFAVMFGIYCALSNYLGWGEFVPLTAQKRGGRVYLNSFPGFLSEVSAFG